MLPSELRILRVFGVPAAQVSAVLRAARADGCPGLRLLERDGEFAVCVQVSAPTKSMAEEYCEKWVQKLRARFGDAVYGMGEISLAQATLDALLKKRRLLVAADEQTGRLVGALLRPLDHSEAAFDFGTQTYADPVNSAKIITPPTLLKRFPGDVVQASAGRAQLAMMAGGADFAAVYMPATVGQAPFVLVCDKRAAVALAIAPDMGDAAIANSLLDLVRRRTLGLHNPDAAIAFRPGHERPLLIFSPEGQTLTERGDTTRFSLRRRPVTKQSAAADFEPMMDFDTDIPLPTPNPARTAAIADAVRAAAESDAMDMDATVQPPAQEDGAITFEAPDDVPPAQTFGTAPQPLPDPLAIETAGAETAAAARARRTRYGTTRPIRRAAPEAPTAPSTSEEERQTEQQNLAKSLLDEEIPDFSAALDPDAIAAANAADEKAGPRSPDELQRAADLLFADADEEDPPPAKPRRKAKKAEKPAAPPVEAQSLRSRSLEMIERSERRHRRNTILATILLLLLLGAAGTGLWWYFHNDLGVVPSPKNYGTAGYDELAGKYLTAAERKLDGVCGYLSFPGTAGRFVYTADVVFAETEADAEPAARFATTSGLGSATPTNTVIDCGGTALTGMAQLTTAQANSGFTLYLPGETYRYKVVAVYYADAADPAYAFDPTACADLSGYYTYLDFVLGTGVRSLYDTNVKIADNASFLTLISDSETPGVRICVTGRLLGANESTQLNGATVTAAQNPLLTTAQYAANGTTAPDAAALLAQRLARFNTDAAAATSEENAGQANPADTGTLNAELTELSQRTQELLDSTDAMMAGLTDVAGNADAVEADIGQGAEGSLPEKTVAVETLATPAPTATPTPAPAESEATSETVTTEAAPETQQPSSAEGETLNVNMNGSDQTLDLVQCLAMIAQNELGSNAPLEAYKAQCVAAHCWIISQNGYPAVLGATPGSAALEAAQAVAHVLVTYNGNVCFTPYFASASTGTASAAEVWGNDRPWLQAVDSPYDQTVGTNWNTNGANTGCARFARQALQDRILEQMGIDLSGLDPNSWFTILSANQYGWVSQMQIGANESGNDTCSGRWFRETLTARCSVDGRSLRSQCFTFTYDAELDCFIFDVYGYGHGCGMSQWGAIGYANNGWDYAAILTHYFPGTTLTTY